MVYTWNPLTPWGPCSPLFPARPWRNANRILTWSQHNIIIYFWWSIVWTKMLTAGPGGPAAPSSPSFPCTPCKTVTVLIRFVPWWSPSKNTDYINPLVKITYPLTWRSGGASFSNLPSITLKIKAQNHIIICCGTRVIKTCPELPNYTLDLCH